MTEREWWTSEDVCKMAVWAAARGLARQRRVRLIDCAAARQMWANMTEPASRHAVEVAERLADGEASAQEVKAACEQAEQARMRVIRRGHLAVRHDSAAAALAVYLVHPAPAEFAGRWFLFDVAFHPPGPSQPLLVNAVYGSAAGPEGALTVLRRRAQAGVLRCILGNPFRPAILATDWRTPTVVQLAHAAYDERFLPSGHLDPARLAVLSDALEEAGCTEADVLNHLRSPGVHVRGCWLVDLLTGRS